MQGLRTIVVLCVLSAGCIEAYQFYRSNILDSLRMLQDEHRYRRKTADILDEMYFKDLLAPYYERRLSDSKRSRSVSESNGCSERSKIVYTSPSTATLDVRFPSVHTTKDDMYMCTGYKVPFDGKESFIVKFTPHADMEQTHHMLVYGCKTLDSKRPSWDCAQPCEDGKTLYAWARNAPELTLPKGVGFSIGRDSDINYIVVQMHFAKTFDDGSCAGVTADITTQPQNYYAGIFLLGAYNINLPAHSSNVPASVACMNRIPDPMHVFAFRTHAHAHANVITGYVLHERSFKMIGKGNPKWPQSFYPRVGGEIVLKPGDILSAQCIYNNTENKPVHAGSTGSDEMCNLYLMFYTSNKGVMKEYLECWGLPKGVKERDFFLPKSAREMPPYPGYAGQDSEDAISNGRAVIPEVPPEHIHNHHGAGDHDKDADGPVEDYDEPEGDPIFEEPTQQEADSDAKFKELEKSPQNDSGTLSRGHGMPKYQGLQADLSYPELQNGYGIGAVGGLVAAKDGSVYVFHRAGRDWTATSFDAHNRFTEPTKPIMEDTVCHLSNFKGTVLHSWGSNQFFMPHGASLDHDGYLWLTDVAMHQVFKYPAEGAKEPLLALGQRMVPGSDIHHFCKPTDVAVDSDGMIYVSDGYCNGRVIKFSPDGSFVTQWGRMVTTKDLMTPPAPPYAFFIAHNIVLCGEDESELCVADRENGRIQCFTKDGKLTRVISDQENTGDRVFAITYSPLEGGLIYGVNGPGDNGEQAGGFTMHYDTGVVMKRWQPSPNTPLSDPHDISASPGGQQVYVGDLTHKKVFKFTQAPSAQEGNVADKSQDGDSELAAKKSDRDSDNSAASIEQIEKPDDDKENIPVDVGGAEMVEVVREFPDEEVNPSGVATIIIVCLVVLPTVAILIAFTCIRVRAKRLKEYESLLSSNGKSSSKSLNLGKFLKPAERKGFTRVSSEGSEDESDVEVYSKKAPEDEENSVE